MTFALVGNQNCGKTTLFNALTGSNQHVGNFPGVTVDQKMGEMRDEKACSVVDLPGIYSLRPYTQEEIVTRDFIINQKPDGIINIVDATNIERNLYLTLQLLELRVPMVLALNMMDEVRANGGSIDVQKMSSALGIPVVPIAAAKGEGVSELVDQAITVARRKVFPKVTDFCSETSAVHRCIHAVVHLIADHADRIGIPARFCAAKLIEGGDDLSDQLGLDENEKELLEHCIVQMEAETGLDRNAALADMRYSFIEGVVEASVVKCHESREHARSMKIDRILTGRYTAIPTFLAIMLVTFYLTFHVIGQRLSDWLEVGVSALTTVADHALTAYGINPVVHSLIIDGIFAGVGSVLVFLPIIVTLFFFLSILEDTGYMARVAFVMDKPLRKIGLSGRSIVPMLIGVLANTFIPNVLEIGGFTSGMFKTGTACLLGMFLLLNGASIDVKKIGMPLYKGCTLTLMKFVVGIVLGLLVAKIGGAAGFCGITSMAMIAGITNSAGGLYLGLAQQYGDETDAGAISILSLNDGPFFTMIAMGTAGMASIPIESFIATLIPLIIGIIWGNLDKTFRKVAADAMPIITFFMMIPIGAGMSLKSIALGGVGGVVLAIISALSAFLFYFLFQLTLPKNKRNAMGAAIGTTAANATSVPASLAEVDPAWQSAASTATAQLAVAAIVTAFTAPIITSMCDKHMRKKKLGIYSDAAIAEREAKEKQGA